MSSEIAIKGAPAVRTMDDLERVSKMFAQSGLFKDTRDAAQCGIRILAGLEMGFGAFQSMTGVHIIQGKPSLGAHLIAAAIKRTGRYNYRVREHTDEVCTIAFLERNGSAWDEVGVSTFSMADAKKANLLNNPTWRNYPRNMLYSRAISNGARWFTPDIFGAPVYTPDELGADVDEEGNVIEVEATPTQPEKPVEAKQEKPVGIGDKRAKAMLKRLSEADYNAPLPPIRELAELSEEVALQIYNDALRSIAKEETRPVWETWKDDSEAQAYGAQAKVFESGQELMHQWERHKEFASRGPDGPLDVYQTWHEFIAAMKEGKRKAA